MKTILIMLVLLTSSVSFGQVKVFLHSSLKTDGKGVSLSDIARIGGTHNGAVEIDEIMIEQKHLENGYISRKTVQTILQENGITGVVYGTSVRLLPIDKKNGSVKKSSLVDRGDIVDIIISRNGILIETTGTSLVKARPGDKVTVKVNSKGRRLKGILLENRKVEVGG
ncbi:MAG: flagella basal body P-ring formation protein FlgA [Spirochaetes bacterium]|nr:flagella basal body P-ring formation protein FlgA [Spirochaetota bacterium]MBN2770937.1 flagella basal body P-ring formation protein FlgA [Spirochaetota bacterium]